MGQDSTHNRSYFLNAGEEEKSIFLSTLCTLANADGKIKDSEVRFIESLAAEMQTEVLPQFFKYSAELCIRRLALELIKDMLSLAYTDDEFSDSEGQFICSIGDALNIEPQKIGQISSWVIDRIIWLEQEALIFEETANRGGEHGKN